MDGWDAGMWALVAGLVAVVVSVIGAFLSASAKKEAVSLATVQQAITPLQQVIKAAEGWVAVAQYLWEKGEIPEVDGVKDARFYFVFNKVRPYLPGVDIQTMEYGIEAAVKMVKAALANASSSSPKAVNFVDSANLPELHVKNFVADAS